jgi:hypothetical protein
MIKRGVMPKTKLEDLVEFYKEIKMHENLAFARLSCDQFTENEALNFLKEKRKSLEERYSSKLNPCDKYEFNSIDKMGAFLKSAGFNKKRIEDATEHESMHYNEALNRGFNNCKFSCWIVEDGKKTDFVCQTTVAIDSMLSYEDYQKISHAPKQHGYSSLDGWCIDYSKYPNRSAAIK